MLTSPSGWSDQRIEVLMGNLLRVGVVLAAVVSLIGGAVYLAHAGNTQPEYKVFHGEPADLRDARGVVGNAFSGNGGGIIQLGLLLLIATPVARVVFSAFAFAIQRDWRYVVVTVAVMAVLAFSLSGGHL